MTEYTKGNSRTITCRYCGAPFCTAEGPECDCLGANEEEIEEIKDTLCEACHGRWLFDETECPSTCEGFARVLEELRKERI